jgi:hypothetical protein
VRPYQPVERKLRPVKPEELVVGRWFKIYSRVGIVRTVYLREVSVCKRYCLISYSQHGKTHDASTTALYLFEEPPPPTVRGLPQ